MLYDIQLNVYKTVFTPGATITFNEPIINYGNGYRSDLGIFEPPVNGVYSFTVTICTFWGTWMVFGLMKDNTILDKVMVGDDYWHQCSSSTTYTYLTTDNRVLVKVLQTNNGMLNNDKGLGSFKGTLLSKSSP